MSKKLQSESIYLHSIPFLSPLSSLEPTVEMLLLAATKQPFYIPRPQFLRAAWLCWVFLSGWRVDVSGRTPLRTFSSVDKKKCGQILLKSSDRMLMDAHDVKHSVYDEQVSCGQVVKIPVVFFFFFFNQGRQGLIPGNLMSFSQASSHCHTLILWEQSFN